MQLLIVLAYPLPHKPHTDTTLSHTHLLSISLHFTPPTPPTHTLTYTLHSRTQHPSHLHFKRQQPLFIGVKVGGVHEQNGREKSGERGREKSRAIEREKSGKIQREIWRTLEKDLENSRREREAVTFSSDTPPHRLLSLSMDIVVIPSCLRNSSNFTAPRPLVKIFAI